jgi:GNAT superfamily N-acetyltransferase
VIDAERIEATAYRGIAEATGGSVVEAVRGGVCLANHSVPITELNRVVGVTAELDVDAVEAFYARVGVRPLVALPPWLTKLERELRARGYARGHQWTKFEREPEPAPHVESTLRVEAARDGGAFGRALAEGFGSPREAAEDFAALVGRPGWSCFVAWDGAEAAAAATLFVDEGVAWLGAAATRPAFRGRGAQSALLAARIEAARGAGAQLLTVETGTPVDGVAGTSYRNILRAGFRESYVRANWRGAA